MKKRSDVLSVDDALYQLMSLSVARSYALEKGEKKVAQRILSRMRSFCFQNLSVCRKAADKYKAMSDDEKSLFYRLRGAQAEEKSVE